MRPISEPAQRVLDLAMLRALWRAIEAPEKQRLRRILPRAVLEQAEERSEVPR